MHLVSKPIFYPAFCAVSLKTEDERGFVDVNTEIPPPLHASDDFHVYLSVSSIEELGQKYAGLISQEDHRKTVDSHADLEEKVEAQEQELTELRQFKESVRVLEASGLKSSKRIAAAS